MFILKVHYCKYHGHKDYNMVTDDITQITLISRMYTMLYLNSQVNKNAEQIQSCFVVCCYTLP